MHSIIVKETLIPYSRHMFYFYPSITYIFEVIPNMWITFITSIGPPIQSAKAMKKIIKKLACSYSKLNIYWSTYSLTLTFNEIPFVEWTIWIECYTAAISSALIIYFSFVLNAFIVCKGWKITSFYKVWWRKGLVREWFIFLASLLKFRRCCKD